MLRSIQFSRKMLYPRYWLLWIGIGILYITVLLPYPILYYLGCSTGRFSMYFMKRRAAIAHRNLMLCFPIMTLSERNAMIERNFKSVGMGLLETGIAWFWPDWRVRKWFTIVGYENILHIRDTKQGILLIGIHFLTLELGARIFGILNPGVGVCRPNDNLLLNWLQTKGRLRSNKRILDRKDIKGMIHALKTGEILWYAPDHDYGPKNSVFVPFFSVQDAATTKGSYMLINSTNPAIISFVPRRLPNAKGYELVIMPEIKNIPIEDAKSTATRINQVIEEAILQAPDQYMWIHRRFKTRPPGQPKLY